MTDNKQVVKKELAPEEVIEKGTRPLALLHANMKGMVYFQMLYRAMCMVIFFPVLIYVEKLLLVVNNKTNLTQANALSALLNPLTWLVLLTMWFLISFFISLEQFGNYSILHASLTGKKSVTAREGFDNAVDITIANMNKSFFLMMLYYLLIYPFSDFLNTSSLTRFFTLPGFISEHLNKYPALGISATLVALVLGYCAFRLAYILPAMVTERLSFRDAAKRSLALTKGKNRFKLILALASYVIAMTVMFVFLFFLLIVAAILIVLWLEPGFDLTKLVTFTNFEILIMVLTVLYGWLVQPVVCSVVASRYYRLILQEGIVPEAYDMKKEHILQKKPVRIAWGIFCFVCMYFSIPSRYQQFKWILRGNSANTMIMAHRGYSDAAPENTIPAFEKAVENGATAVELDVQMTKDGEIVVLHDDNLKRTAGLDANIWDVTYDEIKDLDNGSFFSAEYAGTRIPTLQEVLQYARGKLYLNIEIKRTGHDEGIEDKVVQIIRNNDFENDCDITSMDYDTLVYINQRYPDILLAYTSTVGLGDIQNLSEVQIISIQETFATYETVSALHLAGKKVFVWTVNDQNAMDRLVGLNVDAILTNDLNAAKSVMERHTGISDTLQRLNQILYYF